MQRMKPLSEEKFQQYKRDFLKHNRCTVAQFVAAWDAFMKNDATLPNGETNYRAYRMFAQKWNIRVIQDNGIPYELALTVCVQMASMKMMAGTAEECVRLWNNLVNEVDPLQ